MAGNKGFFVVYQCFCHVGKLHKFPSFIFVDNGDDLHVDCPVCGASMDFHNIIEIKDPINTCSRCNGAGCIICNKTGKIKCNHTKLVVGRIYLDVLLKEAAKEPIGWTKNGKL